jgi:hypothetical protein
MAADNEAKPGLSTKDKDDLLQMIYEARDNG